MLDYDNDTWEDNPRRKVCRAPACRCESPCDDYNDSGKRCARCYKSPDDCNCERCDSGECFLDDCIHCGDCGEHSVDCVCEGEREEVDGDKK